MKKLLRHSRPKIFLLILSVCLFAVVCLVQSGLTRECKAKDYDCRIANYINIVFSECKPMEGYNYDCFVARQTKNVEANPGDVAAYFYRGMIYSNREPDRAIADFSKALELDPKYRAAYSHLASAYRDKGEYDLALTSLNKAIDLDPKDANTYDNRGYAYLAQRAFSKALGDFDKVIELEPNSDRGYIGRAAVYADQRDFAKAIAEYNKVIKVNPRDWFNYYSRGALYWRLGEKAKADADCQKAKELRKGVRRPIPKITTNTYCAL